MTWWQQISVLCFIGLIILYIIKTDRKLKESKLLARLFVIFNDNIDVPNILENERLQKIGRWEPKGKQSFEVYSEINNEKLREEIMKEYQLSEEDVSVYDPSASHTATRFL